MDLEFNEQQKMFQSAVREFCRKEMEPLADEYEKKGEFPRHIIMPKAGKLGYNLITCPREYGGVEMSLLEQMIINEEAAKISLGLAESFCLGSYSVAPAIWTFGTKQQCNKYIPPTLKGEWISALALTEHSGGSDPATRTTTAKIKNGKWIVNGSNIFITNGSICDYQLILAWNDKTRKPSQGMTAFVIDWPKKGWSRRSLNKMGSRASDEAEVFYDDMELSDDNVLGPIGRGFPMLLWIIDQGRACHSARSLGSAQAAFDLALAYTKQRVVWGQPISRHQSISFKFAEMDTEIEATRALVYKAGWKYVHGDQDASRFSAVAKLFASEMNQRVARICMQMFGCYGLMLENRAQRFFRDSSYLMITEGTPEMLKMVISRSLNL
jgi:acyl-CoA dehydrogenase